MNTTDTHYPTARGLIDLVKSLESPEPANPNLTARIDVRFADGEKETVWVRAGGDMIGLGGTVQARMARMIQDTWQRLHRSRGDAHKTYPNKLYIFDHGSVTISDMAPHHPDLPDRLKQAIAVLPCYLPSRAAAAFLCLTSD